MLSIHNVNISTLKFHKLNLQLQVMWLTVTEILRVIIELKDMITYKESQHNCNKFWKQISRDNDVCLDVISDGS